MVSIITEPKSRTGDNDNQQSVHYLSASHQDVGDHHQHVLEHFPLDVVRVAVELALFRRRVRGQGDLPAGSQRPLPGHQRLDDPRLVHLPDHLLVVPSVHLTQPGVRVLPLVPLLLKGRAGNEESYYNYYNYLSK